MRRAAFHTRVAAVAQRIVNNRNAICHFDCMLRAAALALAAFYAANFARFENDSFIFVAV